jgi:hypothetical protein
MMRALRFYVHGKKLILRGGCLFLAGREEKLRGSGGIYA